MLAYIDFRDDDERLVWRVTNLTAGDATLALPRPPAGVVVDDLVPANQELAGRTYVCTPSGRALAICDRWAIGDVIFDLVF